MQDVKVSNSGGIILLGKQGENLARRVLFDLTDWQALYGEGMAELICQRPGEDSVYPVAITQDGPAAIWEITDTDTTRPGVGHCELRYYVDETLAKSETWMTKITKAMEGDLVSPPAPGQSWADQVLQAGAAAVEAAERAESAAVRQPIVGDNGNWWTWDLEAGAYADTGIYSGGDAPYIGANGNWYVGQTDTGVAAAGPVGPPGPKGPQGPAGPALAVTNTATVGQTIRVSAVDENGKPTEWEAVDFSSGGAYEGIYSLIVEHTIAEDASYVVYTNEEYPGIANLKHILVSIIFPERQTTGWWKVDAGNVPIISGISVSNVKHYYGIADVKCGNWIYSSSGSSNDTSGQFLGSPSTLFSPNTGYVKNVYNDYSSVRIYGSSFTLTAGTVVRIWGC